MDRHAVDLGKLSTVTTRKLREADFEKRYEEDVAVSMLRCTN